MLETVSKRVAFVVALLLVMFNVVVFNQDKPLYINLVIFVVLGLAECGIVLVFYRYGWWRGLLALLWWLMVSSAMNGHLNQIGDALAILLLFVPWLWLRKAIR